MESRFFRVLYTTEGFEQFTLFAQGRGFRGSTHDIVPWTWLKRYREFLTGKALAPNEDDLPLNDPGLTGQFSTNARRRFLELAAIRPTLDFTAEERREIGELAGWCAFETPKAAYDWATDGQNAADLERFGFVEFMGERISAVSEKDGVVASVTTLCTRIPLTVEQFKKRHSL